MKKVILFCSIILGVSQFAYSQNDCVMKERVNKRDVVSSRNMVSGELVPVMAFHLPPVNMKSNVYDIKSIILDAF